MESWGLMLALPLAAAGKIAVWLALIVYTAEGCPEALAVVMEPPLLKCFPPAQQTLILAHLGVVAYAGVVLFA